MSRIKSLSIALSTVLLWVVFTSGCASGGVDMEEGSRVVGLEDGVRVDAQFFGLVASGRGANISIVYEVENLRQDSIALADMVPEASFDSETGTFTVIVGSEVPGHEMLPRLTEIKPGERASFSEGARLVMSPRDPNQPGLPPRDIQLKVVYLQNMEPFRELVDIPEVAVNDPARADEMFNAWIENTRSVTTNAVPLRARTRGGRVPDAGADRP